MNVAHRSGRFRALSAAVMGVAVAVAGMVAIAPSADAATNPLPWIATETSEGEQVGTLSFYDADGTQIYSGSLDSSPMAAYTVASGGVISGDTASGGATAYVYAPAPSDPGLWSNSQLTSNEPIDPGTNANYSALPPSIQSSNDEVVPGLLSFNDALSFAGISNQLGSGDANANVYEIRVIGDNTDQKWYSADIEINTATNTWTQIYPAPPANATWISSITANPSSVASLDTDTVSLSADLSAGDSAHPSGTVEVFDSGNDLGAATYNAANGAITATVVKTATAGDLTDSTMINGSHHSFQFKFTPSGGDSHSASASPTLAWSIHDPAQATTTIVSGPTAGVVGTGNTYSAQVKAGSTALGAADGTVQFMLDGTSAIGSAVPVGTSVSYVPRDTNLHTITATFTPADSQTYQASSDATGIGVTAKYQTFMGSITPDPSSPAPSGTTSVVLSAVLTDCPTPAPTTWTCPVGLPAGSVTVMDGSTSLGSANYTATTGATTVTIVKTAVPGDLTDSTLTDGTSHLFAFTFTPSDNTFASATSAQLSYAIHAPVVATATVVTGPATGALGTQATFTATVTAASGTDHPAGTVQFVVDGRDVGTVVPLVPGAAKTASASYKFTPADTSAHTISARYTPVDPASFAASTDGSGAHFSATAATFVSLITASPSSPAPAGTTSVRLSATLRANGTSAIPTGSVRLFDGGTDLGAATLNSVTGAISATAAVTNGSTHSFQFRFTGSDGYNDSTSSALSYSVGGAESTSITVSSPAKGTVTVAYGKSTTLKAIVKDTSTHASVSGGLTLESSAKRTGPWKSVATTASNSVKPTKTTFYRWVYKGDSTHSASTSAVITVSVSRAASIAKTPASFKHGKSAKVYGTVAPAAGGRATLQELVKGKWKSVGSATIKKQKLPNGKSTIGYVIVFRSAAKGTFALRVQTSTTTGYVAGTSATTTIRVS